MSEPNVQPQAPKKIELPDYPLWDCQIKPHSEPINVGTKMDLNCTGSHIELLQKEKVNLQFEYSDLKYTLHILETRHVDHQSLQFTATSYKAGAMKNPPTFVISDGTNGIKVNNLKWTVESVLPPPPEQPKPYPLVGPFQVPLPWWFWASIILGLAVILSFIGFKLKKYWERKKLIDQLATHGTALTPYHQFTKDLRVVVRSWQRARHVKAYSEEGSPRLVVENLNKLVRQYMMRELLIPTLDWSDGEILKEMRKRHWRVFKGSETEVKKFFREMRQALKDDSQVSELDCEQFIFMSRNLAEKVNSLRKGKA